MNGLELLQKYPLAGKVVKDWFVRTMLESVEDQNVPEEFKNYVLEQGVEDDKVAALIDVNVRVLFDVFDENEIHIGILTPPDWSWEISPGYTENGVCKSRKEAERAAVEAAFEILEQKLSPTEEEKN